MPGNAKKKCAKPGSLYVQVQRQKKDKADEWESVKATCEEHQGMELSGRKVQAPRGPAEIAERSAGNHGLTDLGYVKKSDFTLQATLPEDKKDKYCVTLPELNGKKGIVPAQELGSGP